MKKKGLIISTIVMVVVLIASLTTATYAWFTASSTVQVNTIELSIKSDAAVNVGVKKGDQAWNNTLTDRKTPNNYSQYLYQSVTSNSTNNTVSWTGGTSGLGSVLTFANLSLGVSQAIGTAEEAAGVYTVDAGSFDRAAVAINVPTKKIVKAPQGASNTEVDSTSATEAKANQEYLNAVIGVEANKADIKGMYVKVVVTTKDDLPILGMNAALHFVIRTDAGTIEYEPFRGYDYQTTKISESVKSTVEAQNTNYGIVTCPEDGKFVSTFYFWVAKDNESFITGGKSIRDIQIMAFIAGWDTDCNSNAVGTACTIDISFDGTKNITYLSDAEKANPADENAPTVESKKFLVFA